MAEDETREEEELTLSEMFDETLANMVAQLADLEPGSEAYERQVKAINMIRSMSIDDSKLTLDYNVKSLEAEAKEKELEIEEKKLELKVQEMDMEKSEGKKSRIMHWGLGLLGICVPAVAYNHWVKKGYEYEKEGIVTNDSTRNVISQSFKWIGSIFR